jgi:hypothetical protein
MYPDYDDDKFGTNRVPDSYEPYDFSGIYVFPRLTDEQIAKLDDFKMRFMSTLSFILHMALFAFAIVALFPLGDSGKILSVLIIIYGVLNLYAYEVL